MSLADSEKYDLSPENADGKPVRTGSLRNTYFAAVAALLYVLAVGMVSTYPAPATVDMAQPGSRLINITPNQITWIASLPLISGVFGNLFSGYATQKVGRKAVLMFLSFPFVLSWLLIAYASSVEFVYIGRLLAGLCAGMAVVTVPVYLVEIAPKEIRGMLTTWIHVAVSLGTLFMMTLGVALRWSWLALCGGILTTIAACLMLIMPESPPWLVRKGRNSEALDGLKFLRGKKQDVGKEFREFTEGNSQEQNARMTPQDLLDPAFYKPVAISVALMFFLAFSGFSSIMSYTVKIFKDTGSSIDPRWASVIIALVQLVGTLTSSVLMDRSGRRRLYITSAIFVTGSLLILGLHNFLTRKYALDGHLYCWIPLVSFVVYMFTFSLGMGPMPFVMPPELVSLRTRSTVLAIATFAISLFGFLVTKTFDDMVSLLNLYGVFWTYAFFTFISVFFGFFVLPETKGLTMDEIQRKFSIKR